MACSLIEPYVEKKFLSKRDFREINIRGGEKGAFSGRVSVSDRYQIILSGFRNWGKDRASYSEISSIL